ncbi:MAG: rod shape-determining protein MreD [Eubacterium sp.]|nr:rod shape-determining protein MreD [Eubacterium sp.]
METAEKKSKIRYALWLVMLLIAALLQNVGGLFPEIGGARCFLLIPVCVMLGINEDERTAAFIGLFGGFLWDSVCSRHTGFNCIYLMFICFIASSLVTYIFRNTFMTGFIACAGATVLYCLLYWLFFILTSGSDGAGTALLRFYIPCAVYTVVLTPFIEALVIAVKSRALGTRQLDA